VDSLPDSSTFVFMLGWGQPIHPSLAFLTSLWHCTHKNYMPPSTQDYIRWANYSRFQSIYRLEFVRCHLVSIFTPASRAFWEHCLNSSQNLAQNDSWAPIRGHHRQQTRRNT
jgi:hypothetical protein